MSLAVTRVLVGARTPAVAGQPPGVAETERISTLAELTLAAGRAKRPLLWILDSRAVPAADALDSLLDAGTRPAASLPLDADGEPVERLIGRYAHADLERLVRAVERRQLPLAHTHVISLLVERDDVLTLTPPDPVRFREHAATEWTTRLLRRHPGVLVPASRVRAPDPPRSTLAGTVRMARTGAWEREETLRELRRVV